MRLLSWGRLVGEYVSVQIVVQAFSLGSGILLIHRLSKGDYALFTIANTMLGAISLLADSGISSGLTSIGGRVWNDSGRLSQVVETALSLRRQLGVAATLLVAPVLAWLLMKNGAGVGWSAAIIATVLVTAMFQMGAGVLVVVPKLLLKTRLIQRIDLSTAVLRLAMIGAAALLYLNVWIALAIGTVAAAVQWGQLRQAAAGFVGQKASVDPAIRTEILRIVRVQAPNTLYFCLQGQVSVWLISIFGTSSLVADVGALGRLAMLFTLTGSVTSTLIVPRYARLQDQATLRRRYWQIVAAYVALIASLTTMAAAFPDFFLMILGGKYTHLRAELPLMVAGSALTAAMGAVYTINAARGWIVPTWLNVGLSVVSQIICLNFVDVGTVRGVIILGCAPALPELISLFVLAMVKIRNLSSPAELLPS